MILTLEFWFNWHWNLDSSVDNFPFILNFNPIITLSLQEFKLFFILRLMGACDKSKLCGYADEWHFGHLNPCPNWCQTMETVIMNLRIVHSHHISVEFYVSLMPEDKVNRHCEMMTKNALDPLLCVQWWLFSEDIQPVQMYELFFCLYHHMMRIHFTHELVNHFFRPYHYGIVCKVYA